MREAGLMDKRPVIYTLSASAPTAGNYKVDFWVPTFSPQRARDELLASRRKVYIRGYGMQSVPWKHQGQSEYLRS